MDIEKTAWKAVGWVAALAAATAARQAASLIWDQVSDTSSPVNPADRKVDWAQAAGWAALAGLSAGLARVVARRGAASVWENVTGDAPPGVRTL